LTKKFSIYGVLIFSWIYSCLPAYSNKVYVGPGKYLKSICEGVSAAMPGDTVMVESGLYREGILIIRKSIHIMGIGQPILDGEHKYENITISGKNISFSGFKLINSGSSAMDDIGAIKCIDSRDISIYDNLIENAHFAIHISNTEGILVKNNLITGYPKNEQNTGNGIHIWKSSHAVIENNQVSGHRDGIYLEFVTESKILHNLSFKNIRY
jgi:nitrous oxidase accessory protein